jgi:hypothetical protein
MAKDDGQEWNEASEGAQANSGEWGTEVESEAQIVLEAEGEGVIATWVGMDPPNANGIIQGHFEDVNDLNEQWLGDAFFMNLTRDLERKMRKVPEKATVRLEWVSSMNTGQKTPMRVFKVQWR